ncbi:MAG: hypothetical protein ACLFR1_11930 [Spirochaetia bacterium]
MKTVRSVCIIIALLAISVLGMYAQDENTVTVGVLPIRNNSERSHYDMPAGSATRLLILNLGLMNEYDVFEIPEEEITDTDIETIREYAEMDNVDNVIFGTLETEGSGVVINLTVYDRAEDRFTIEHEVESRDIFEIFEVMDTATYDLVEAFSGVHIGFGTLEIVNTGASGEYVVFLNGNMLEAEQSEFDDILIGDYRLEIQQNRMFGRYRVLTRDIVIQEERTTEVEFSIPEQTQREEEALSSVQQEIDNNIGTDPDVVQSAFNRAFSLLEDTSYSDALTQMREDLEEQYENWQQGLQESPEVVRERSEVPEKIGVNELTLNRPETGYVYYDDNYTLEFTPSDSGLYDIEILSSEIDTVMSVFDEAGNELAEDDDSGENLLSRISLIHLDASQTYLVQVRGYRNTMQGEFTVEARFVGEGSEDIGNTIDTQAEIGVDEVQASAIEVSGDNDVFRFIAPESGIYEIETFGEMDTVLDVADSNGDIYITDDDGGEGLRSYISATFEQGVTYYINVRGYSSVTGSYEVVVRFAGAGKTGGGQQGDQGGSRPSPSLEQASMLYLMYNEINIEYEEDYTAQTLTTATFCFGYSYSLFPGLGVDMRMGIYLEDLSEVEDVYPYTISANMFGQFGAFRLYSGFGYDLLLDQPYIPVGIGLDIYSIGLLFSYDYYFDVIGVGSYGIGMGIIF